MGCFKTLGWRWGWWWSHSQTLLCCWSDSKMWLMKGTVLGPLSHDIWQMMIIVVRSSRALQCASYCCLLYNIFFHCITVVALLLFSNVVSFVVVFKLLHRFSMVFSLKKNVLVLFLGRYLQFRHSCQLEPTRDSPNHNSGEKDNKHSLKLCHNHYYSWKV